MLLSIIVPVYNVEKYLCRCVDSLLDQGDFKNYEIILVDDGSTDNSVNICDSYAENFDLVKVIHKVNGGLSSARNAGIKSASGEYVMFVDSDDFIKTDILKDLIDKISCDELQVLSYNFSYIYDDGAVKINNCLSPIQNSVVTGVEYLTQNLSANLMLMTAWKNIYSLSLIKDMPFREGYVHEDEEWTPRVFYSAKRVEFINEVVYGYTIRNSSISHNNNVKAAKDLISNCRLLKKFAVCINESPLRNLYQDYLTTLTLSAFYKGRLLSDYKNVIEIIDGLYISDRNKKKIALLKKSPKQYLFLNSASKRIEKSIKSLSKLKQIVSKGHDYLAQKLHKKMREYFVCPKQKRLLTNHSFSIISSNCNGGVITSELGEQFRSPTINMWVSAVDYLKFIKNLNHYINININEVKNNFEPYPVGKLDDITLYFMHYHTFEEAANKWNERKKRINYDNLFFMMAERNGCTPDMVREFDNLPYKNKVIFTYNEYPDCPSAICVKECSLNGEAAIMTDFVGLTGRKYDKYFDYIKWLNEGARK